MRRVLFWSEPDSVDVTYLPKAWSCSERHESAFSPRDEGYHAGVTGAVLPDSEEIRYDDAQAELAWIRDYNRFAQEQNTED